MILRSGLSCNDYHGCAGQPLILAVLITSLVNKRFQLSFCLEEQASIDTLVLNKNLIIDLSLVSTVEDWFWGILTGKMHWFRYWEIVGEKCIA